MADPNDQELVDVVSKIQGNYRFKKKVKKEETPFDVVDLN